MDTYTLKDYEVMISFTSASRGDLQCQFDVMAYTKEEAENLAFSEWSDLDYDSISTLEYYTEEVK
ncbi:hypothetical protein NVP1170O_113 [Vibrio phage 1.170.O._10N.261.52.C3]|nr:hypothetical protein NVP1170O_113 [Vibrio phage 1.170.O._10N.261.52.C3]